jgi:hypothetical protein
VPCIGCFTMKEILSGSIIILVEWWDCTRFSGYTTNCQVQYSWLCLMISLGMYKRDISETLSWNLQASRTLLLFKVHWYCILVIWPSTLSV